MTKLSWIAGAFALAVLVPAGALVGFGFHSLAREEARLRSEERAEFEKSADSAVDAVVRRLRDREDEESKRSFAEYQHLYSDPKLLTANVAVGCSPLAQIPTDRCVSGHFEMREDGTITTPLVGPDVPGLPTPRDDSAARDAFLTTLQSELHDRLEPPDYLFGHPDDKPVRLEEIGPEALDLNRNINSWATDIARARGGDAKSQARIMETQISNFAASGETVRVRYYRFHYLPVGHDALYAWRLVKIGKEFRNQGYRVDVHALRETVVPDILAKLPASNLLASAHVAGESPKDAVVVRRIDDPPLGLELAFRERDPQVIPHRVSSLRLALGVASGALVLLLGAGFFVIGRVVRAEVDLARKKSDFVSAVTHELKTPLSAIRMYGELLEAGWVKDRETEKRYFGTITAESERLSRLIDNVLDYARLERHEKQLKLEAGDLGEAVRRTCDVLRPHVESSGFALHVHVDEDLPRRPFDRDAIAQILVNLVDNAVKYSRDAEQKEIDVAVRPADDRVTLDVTDHGPGIPAAEREHVFEQFYRVGNDLTRETHGVGLGLTLVRGLARAHGGSVEIADDGGGGTRVRVTL
ncbi:MAG: HAMP domain-containing histidine kinase [Planctomycetes bacterium]|nr:HAMP domain-containing histidine kinase [Planctomycetota bacterium]MBI3846602.1 HAMP domain-containing histidine kinase [Planctomycetota bacterium]